MSIFVIGSGLSGVIASLEIARYRDVYLVSKTPYNMSSSYWAKGGIACSLLADDSYHKHLCDTFTASGNTSERDRAYDIISQSRSSLKWLTDNGFSCTKHEGHIHLTREGGHSKRRVVHYEDATGYYIMESLYSLVRSNPRIQLMENTAALQLIIENKTCVGIKLSHLDQSTITTYKAGHVVLSCGGLGQVYLNSTNPIENTGDGIALAWKAGCEVVNMEFIQFHPTGFYAPDGTVFLVTEALRGEGGKICDKRGYCFVKDFDSRGDLAPRDVVSRAIFSHLQQNNEKCAYIDISHRKPDFIRKRFPNLYMQCKKYNVDITSDLIPVIPSAHYCCGGVLTNRHGETAVQNLWAIGETAYTGLHGANRLASNSLLECLVTGRQCARAILSRRIIANKNIVVEKSEPLPNLRPNPKIRTTIQEIMSQHVSIIRSTRSLKIAAEKLSSIITPQKNTDIDNMYLCAQLIIKSSQQRKNSYGCYYNEDFKSTGTVFKPTYLVQ